MKFLIKAFYDDDDITTHKSTIIQANSKDEAQARGWELFPDCESVGVREVDG